MIRKPFKGKKVVILDSSECCGSPVKEGSKGVITRVVHQDCFAVKVEAEEEVWYHCNECLGPRR